MLQLKCININILLFQRKRSKSFSKCIIFKCILDNLSSIYGFFCCCFMYFIAFICCSEAFAHLHSVPIHANSQKYNFQWRTLANSNQSIDLCLCIHSLRSSSSLSSINGNIDSRSWCIFYFISFLHAWIFSPKLNKSTNCVPCDTIRNLSRAYTHFFFIQYTFYKYIYIFMSVFVCVLFFYCSPTPVHPPLSHFPATRVTSVVFLYFGVHFDFAYCINTV